MLQCSFELNGQPMSKFLIGARLSPAFSGDGKSINARAFACALNMGPIPPGEYYILTGKVVAILNGLKTYLAIIASGSPCTPLMHK